MIINLFFLTALSSFTLSYMPQNSIKESKATFASRYVYNAEDGQPSPIITLTSVYPTDAAKNGIVGQCTIVFDVKNQGSNYGKVSRLDSVVCTPSGVFEKACSQSLKYWSFRYKEDRNKDLVMQCIYEKT